MLAEENFSSYIKDITMRHTRLSAKDELSLGKRVCAGDESAVTKLVESNLPLVVSMAKRYTSFGISLSDLIQEGNIGLIRAARTFDYKRKVRFSTHATWKILAGIRRALDNQSRLVRQPSEFQHQHYKARAKFEEAEHLGKPLRYKLPGKLARIKNYHPDNFEFKYVSLSGIKLSKSDAEVLSYMEDYNELEYLMKVLTPEEKKIIILRFGLYENVPHTKKQISKIFGFSSSKVGNVVGRALWKMNFSFRETTRKLTRPKRSSLHLQ